MISFLLNAVMKSNCVGVSKRNKRADIRLRQVVRQEGDPCPQQTSLDQQKLPRDPVPVSVVSMGTSSSTVTPSLAEHPITAMAMAGIRMQA